MIDIITGSRVVAQIDKKFGVFVVIYSFQDYGEIEDILDELEIPYNISHQITGAMWEPSTIWFGVFAEIEKVQLFLDGINFDWNNKGWKELKEMHDEQTQRLGIGYWNNP